MKFSVAWLREWVNPPLTAHQLADQLTMAGLEVDAVESVAPPFSGVVVGEVIARQPHPDADKLSLCQVEIGSGEPLAIVCGAANVAAGQRVAVAQIGAQLPGGLTICQAQVRGIHSHGMICSAAELGLAESSDGILELPADAPLGADLRQLLALEDETIEVDLTPDRGDCLGIAGIAREVAVLNRLTTTPVATAATPPQSERRWPVEIHQAGWCPRYLCRTVDGINPEASTPLWMVERLRRSGLRPIHPVVDITNYVMLELGQPLHGFDQESLSGAIQVRCARPGEAITLLDGSELHLRDDTLLIADAERPLALAGIMGGLGSGVTATTRKVLLESAFFTPAAIIGKARSYALHTDSSHRFERGVDPQLQRPALERATALLLAICGGTPGPVVEQLASEQLPPRPWIELRRARLARLLGVTIADGEVVEILQRLGLELAESDDGWRLRPPSHRFDLTIEADLIEEVGRIYGYHRIPNHQASVRAVMQGPREQAFSLQRARLLLVDRDYQEVISYSFVNPELQQQLDPRHPALPLANPLSPDLAVMRTTLWSGLLQALRYNQARQQGRIRLFESGLRFIDDPSGLRQEPMLAGIVSGPRWPEQWGSSTRGVDFFDLKGDLEALLALTGERDSFRYLADHHPALHPGQSARIVRGEQQVGWLGMLHPALEASLELHSPAYLFEIHLGEVLKGRLPAFLPLSKFPSTRRDIAVVIDATLAQEQVAAVIRRHAPEFLRDIIPFDVYNGEKVAPGTKSLALGLIFQENRGNLTDQQVDAATERVIQALAEELQAQLRE